MNELVDALHQVVFELKQLNKSIEQISDGLFHLNLHVGADVSAWTGGSTAAAVATANAPRFQSQGVVKWYDTSEGFGFVSQTGGGPDVFVHASIMPPPGYLRAGQRVVFEFVDSKNGPMAETVQFG